MNTEAIIHEIPEWNITRLRKEVNKLNKRAVKIGAKPIEIVDAGIKLVIHPDYRSLVVSGQLSKEDAPKVRIHQITLVGEPPKMEGYEFVGTLDHITLPGKVIVKTVPGCSVPPEFYDNDPVCNHCGKIRRRNETFILHHVDDNKYQQVGRNCIKDFLGHDPNAIGRFLSALWALVDSFENDSDGDWYGGGGRRDYYYPHQKVLETTAAMIRTYGWVPRSSANPGEGRIATADMVMRVVLPAFDKYAKKEQEALIDSMHWDKDLDKKEADGAIEWLNQQDTSKNEYLHNLKTISEADAVPSAMFGFWCSLIAAYHRHQERLNLNMATRKLNDWVGKEKERRDFKVKVVSLHYFPGSYGTVTLHKMLDEDGRTLIWFANTKSEMDEGNTYLIKGTVKKHDEYKDWKQTVLSRVKVIEKVEDDD